MRVLTVVYAPADVSQARMADVLTRTAARMAEFARGRETGRWVR
jgi:hypothetical protein